MNRRLSVGFAQALLALASLGKVSAAEAKDLIEYFQPMPIQSGLTSSTWGASGVLPREIQNGIEDTSNEWCYWDGRIIKAPDGKYHLFGSRWAESGGHDAWASSVAVHAVSDRPEGPYVYKRVPYTSQSGKGHNVTALTLPDGRYAILVSETRPGDVFISDSLDGPFAYQGSVKINANGYDDSLITSNLSALVRPDGSILMVSRHGMIMLSTSGIMGPYEVQGPSVYPRISGLNNGNAEDPTIWYSGGQYHMTVNWWDARKAYHLTSPDGIKNWKNSGLAYDPTRDFVRYTNGTTNRWDKIERPGVLMENGHVTHFIFSVIDVAKDKDLGNDNHGSKIILVPFDGVSFDADTGVVGNNGGAGTGGGAGNGAGGKAGAAGNAGGSVSNTGGAGQAGSEQSGGAGQAGGEQSAANSGGVSGAVSSVGGSSPAGGASGNDGNAAGGAPSSAGATSGGNSAIGGSSNAGFSGSGGASAGSSGGPIAAEPDDRADSSGCSCKLAENKSSGSALPWLAALGALALRRRRTS